VSGFELVVAVIYLGAAVCFVLGLRFMNSPVTARRGNAISAGGMTAAVLATVVLLIHSGTVSGAAWLVLVAGTAAGGLAGLYLAQTAPMTAMPQLVSLFNAVGGGGAALVGLFHFGAAGEPVATYVAVAVVLDVIIGSVTFSGSLIAAGKLQGLIPGKPITFPGGQLVNLALIAVVVGSGGVLIAGVHSVLLLILLLLASLGFGVTMVLPIGGADMPVVISLLNAFTGTAVAMAGFVIGNSVLMIAGALVGASGAILTKLMADAMNRSIGAIMIGGFGTGDSAAPVEAAGGQVRVLSADDAAIQLAYASKVIIVPGYGLAVAQAQYEVHELASLLEERGCEVSYAIHPVAGRMPGHMNVLLAEAKVPYSQLREMEEINPEFSRTDVALVVGANDVTNPAARRSGTPVSGMPILDVDQARSVIVIKRSMGHGYAGIDNELYTDPKTGMYFGDAKKAVLGLVAAVKTLVG
jgi:NAD(P) transhydrogenase subunit beta